jgi:hypothetical protein
LGQGVWKKKHFTPQQCPKVNVATLALGSWPRQKLARFPAKREAREQHLMLPRIQKSVREWTIHVACDILLESFQRGLQLCFKPHLNWTSTHKVAGVPTLGILGLPFGSLGTKCHLDVGLMERHRVYYKGEGGDFPQV